MKLLKKTFILLSLIVLLLNSCSLPFVKEKSAAITINASPQSSVFIDGKHVGITPFSNEKYKPGEYSIKLMPQSGIGNPWESRIKLSSGIRTIINRQIGQTEDNSSGYVLALEPETSGDKTSLVVVTIPDGAVVLVDGEAKGFSPVLDEDIKPGDRVLTVSSMGYVEQSVNAYLEQGYKLTANIQLLKSQIQPTDQFKNSEATDSSEIKQDEEVLDEISQNEEVLDGDKKIGQDLKPPYVIIQETPTGWLNLRKEPSTAVDNIIKKAYPGEKYKYLKANDIGWYQIELDDKTKAWVSGKYVKLIEK